MSDIVDEHFVPQAFLSLRDYIESGDVCAAQHLIRYYWASACIADWPSVRSVLDLGCGAGYGSHIVAINHPAVRVIGVDYDPRAIAFAKSTYSAPNLRFVTTETGQWIGDTYDCIFSFDVVEHVAHRELMMEQIVNYLNPAGYLLLSTPCGHNENRLSPEWEHHKLEYSSRSLFDFLSRYFSAIIRPELTTFPHRDLFDGVDYLLKMNPVICQSPIQIANPY